MGSGLAFSASGQLYTSNGNGSLYQLDSSTAAGTPIGSGSWVGVGLGFSPTGELYASNGGGKLYQLDLATGSGTLIGAGGWVGAGLAFEPIPEPATASLLALGMLGLAIRRRV